MRRFYARIELCGAGAQRPSLANFDFLKLVDLAHQRVISSARATNASLYDSIVAHFQSAGLRPNFVYKPCRRRPELRRSNRDQDVVAGAINLFTSSPQTVKYRFINDVEPMSVQMFSRLKERASLIFYFVEIVTVEACRLRALSLILR
ncbi:hypothetical protein SB861_51905 [Paraburkholderia sp. SIMBA_049]